VLEETSLEFFEWLLALIKVAALELINQFFSKLMFNLLQYNDFYLNNDHVIGLNLHDCLSPA